MFFRLLMESFRRQRRRKMLAGVAILLGTTAVTAMLALATTIGDRIHKELAVYGANIVVYPKADLLDVKVGGVDVKPASGGAYLKESDLQKLKGIFWANNITGVSPELIVHTAASLNQRSSINGNQGVEVDLFDFVNNVATSAQLTGPTYDSVLNSNVKVGTVLSALATTGQNAYGSGSTRIVTAGVGVLILASPRRGSC